MFTVTTTMMSALITGTGRRRSTKTMGVRAATGSEMRSSWVSATSAEHGLLPSTPAKAADQPDRRVGGATHVPTPQHELTVLATVAHVLRGPLTALATSSELLAEDFMHLDPQQVKGM